MAELHVDMSKVFPKLKLALNDYSDEVQRRALYNTLNTACRPLQTAIRSLVTKQTSAPYSRVSSKIKAKEAHPGRLEWRLDAKDVAMQLSEFKPTQKAGAKDPSLKVWGRQKKYKGVFAVAFRGGKINLVKRIAKHDGSRYAPAGPLGAKTVWGPIIPKEMLREGFASRAELARAIPERVLKRLPHELEQAVIRAKARSGT